MKKLIIMFSTVVIFLSIFLLLFSGVKDKPYDEKTFSLRTHYAYLVDEKLSFAVKVYSNFDDSILLYANKGTAILHDRVEENIVSVNVLESYISNSVLYDEEVFYEYSILLEVDMDSLLIEECYLTISFSNKSYTFNIGSVELNEKKDNFKQINITNLYGVVGHEEVSLTGFVITFNNTTKNSWNISNVSIGNNHQVILNENNIVSILESNDINDYQHVNETSSNGLTILSNTQKTYILPIQKDKELYLYNTYLLIEINKEKYYISNFNYISSNDVSRLSKYIESGILYEF